MREENGNSTKNARIKIDYSKNKPKVNFSYPSKEVQMEGSMWLYIFISCFVVFVSGSIVYELNVSDYNLKETRNMTTSIDYNKTYLYSWTKCAYKNSNYSFEELWIDICEDEKQKVIHGGCLDFLYELFWVSNVFKYILFYPFILSWLIYFPFKKRWQKFYPKFEGWRVAKKVTILMSKDIKKDNEKYYCELPIFNNIILDYNATKDFSKYLKLFEIKEHNFKYYVKPNKVKRLMKKNKKILKGLELNETMWYARFYFKQKPKSGKITIIYK